jgi:integrase
VLRETLGNSERAKNQKTHRKMLYLAMRISMETGIRIGSLRKVKWGHIRKNNALSSTDQKTWILIDVPAENTKTGRRYTINAPIARHLEELRKITKFKGREDLLFTNQKTGEAFSERIWKDGLCEMLVEAGLATWAEGDSNNLRKINVNSGKNHHLVFLQAHLHNIPTHIQRNTSRRWLPHNATRQSNTSKTTTSTTGQN